MVKKTTYCSKCSKEIATKKKEIEELKEKTKRLKVGNIKLEQFNKQLESIANSNKKPWEKKFAVINLVKNFQIEESPEEKKKTSYLLESYLFTEFAKQSMKEYKKMKTESLNK